MILPRRQLTFAFQFLFYVACLVVLAVALAPITGDGGAGVDKLQHLGVFYGLTLLALLAYPRRNLLVLIAGLAVFGAAIEVLQGLAIFARDRDAADWVADMLGVGLAAAPLWPAAWRRAARTAQ